MEPVRIATQKTKDRKVILVGSSGTGKTCLIQRFHRDIFVDRRENTIGVSFSTVDERKTHPLKVKYSLWDTCGTERYRSLAVGYFRDCDVALLVYDVTDESSFEEARSVWRQELLKRAPSAHTFLVAAKCDLQELRVVTTARGKDCAERSGYRYIETSASSGHNVELLFWEVATVISKLDTATGPRFDLSLETSVARLRQVPPEPTPRKKIDCCNIS